MRTLFSIFLCIGACFFFSCNEDLCKETNCQNGGSCKDGICSCPPAFIGTNCEDLVVGKYLGLYNASYDCTFANHELAIELKPGNEINSVTLRNLGDYACNNGDYLLNGQIIADSLTIPSQSVCMQPEYIFEGKGYRKADSLKLSFWIRYPVGGGNFQTDTCRAILLKK